MPDDGIPNNIGDAAGTLDMQDKTIFDIGPPGCSKVFV